MHELILENWKTFTDFIEKTVESYPDVTANYIQYRGQSDSSWKLQPSLTRIVTGDEISEKKAIFYERQAQMEFVSQVHLLDPKITYQPDANPASINVDMQHYSCPTRLIDWSHSPYVALYFAVNENFETDGSLYVWDITSFKMNLKKMHPHHYDLNISDMLGVREFDIVELVFATRKNERIVRQQGSFSISNNILKNHDDIIIDIATKAKKPSGLYKLTIPSKLKYEFLSRLKQMNITPESLFPGLDGLGRTIKESLILRKWTKQ